LCPRHKSTTLLANIDITNRCNLKCPVCFANANHTGKIYEPTFENIVEIMELLRSENPPCSSIQFVGGEPTVRDDLPDLIELAKKMGFVQIQIATNGIKLTNPNYIKDLKDRGLSTICMQFDGITEKPYLSLRGKNLLPLKIEAINSCRKAGFDSIVLIPTLVKGVNDNQVGDIIKFAMKNIDVIRGLNFQPICFAGRYDKSKVLEQRITISDFIELVEEQTDGDITKDDFYPIPFVSPIVSFIEKFTNKKLTKFSGHQHCAAATYVVVDNGKLVPITRFFDVEGFIEVLNNILNIEDDSSDCNDSNCNNCNNDNNNNNCNKYNNQDDDNCNINFKFKFNTSKTIGKLKILDSLIKELPKLIDKSKMPKNVPFMELMMGILRGDYGALIKFQYSTLLIGCIHIMDGYNYNVDRAKRCVIHYATPDKRLIPMCSYNLIHRKEIEEKYSRKITIADDLLNKYMAKRYNPLF
jgi:uncharacterized radical SAM superfamily Fe-S cluster-containing enzyme